MFTKKEKLFSFLDEDDGWDGMGIINMGAVI